MSKEIEVSRVIFKNTERQRKKQFDIKKYEWLKIPGWISTVLKHLYKMFIM